MTEALGGGAGSGDSGPTWTRALGEGREQGHGTARAPTQPVIRGGLRTGQKVWAERGLQPAGRGPYVQPPRLLSRNGPQEHSALWCPVKCTWTLQPVNTRAEHVEHRARQSKTQAPSPNY